VPSEIPWDAVIALGIGGALGAPIAAWLVSKAPQRILGILVGNLIIVLNVRQLVISFEVPEVPAIAAFSRLQVPFLLEQLIYGIKLLKTDRLPKSD
jgi:uncharacterized protein